jgi:riboflavin biosynthesis pyrimidine reductase
MTGDGRDLMRLFPTPAGPKPLQGLYLDERFAPPLARAKSFVYANFVASLDGRISLPDPRTARRAAPHAITNARDWRLFQELAACADALLTSGRHVRDLAAAVSTRSFPVSAKPEYSDLGLWRSARALPPQPAVVILSASLELPVLSALVESGRPVYVATGAAADARRVASLESQGVRVLIVGDGARARARRLVEALAREARFNIAVIGGGEILHAFVVDDALDRLYLTLACRMLGGVSFDTLLTGPVLEHAAPFTLKALHYDAEPREPAGVEQLFAIFDRG